MLLMIFYGMSGYIYNMYELLRTFGFHKHSAKKSRLPCIVIGNLITPRRDSHGYDKSRINMKPFAQTIAAAIKKMAAEQGNYHGIYSRSL
jgi:hypothetical protein